MAGEHILKCFDEIDSRLSIGNKWLIRWNDGKTFTIYQRKHNQKRTRVLIETSDEEEACRILKGE